MQKILDILHKVPAWVLLIIPFAAFLLIVFTISIFTPTVTANHYLFLLAIFVAISVSRIVQLWEFGIQVYHFLFFWFAFVYGILPGLLVVFLSYLLSVYIVINAKKHYLNHSFFGTTVNSFALIAVAIVAGIAGYFFPSFTLSNFLAFPIAACTITSAFEKIMAYKFAGVDWGRLTVSSVVELMINYNLFLFYSAPYLILLYTI